MIRNRYGLFVFNVVSWCINSASVIVPCDGTITVAGTSIVVGTVSIFGNIQGLSVLLLLLLLLRASCWSEKMHQMLLLLSIVGL